MPYNLKDKNIIVTGGSSGIGESIIDLLLENHGTVINIDVNNNSKTKTIISDITRNKDIKKIINSVPDKIDILINNAGIGLVGNIENTNEKDFDKIFEVNVKGLFNITKALKIMKSLNSLKVSTIVFIEITAILFPARSSSATAPKSLEYLNSLNTIGNIGN